MAVKGKIRERLSRATIKRIAESEKAVKAGRVITHEEVKRRLGLN